MPDPLQIVPCTCKLPSETLEKLLQNLTGTIDFEEVFNRLRENCFRPDGFSEDPRDEIEPGTGTMTIHSKSREERPMTYEGKSPCPICDGDVENEKNLLIMSRKLSGGSYAFVKGTKYAFLNPDETFDVLHSGRHFRGINFLLYPSTEHKDINELSLEDSTASYELISELEKNVLFGKFQEDFNFVSCQVVKNMGCNVNEPHSHGPYHVAVMNRFPKRIYEDIRFMNRYSKRTPKEFFSDLIHFRKKTKRVSFIDFFKEKNPKNFEIKDFGSMVAAIPYFMKRRFEVIIYPKDKNIQWFHELNTEQKHDLSRATCDISYALSLIMPAIGKPFDCSLDFHTGPVGTMYSEVFPASQRPGGFERLRLYVCEGTPLQSAQIYKRFFEEYCKDSPENRFYLIPEPGILKEVRQNIILPVNKKSS